MPIAVTIRRPDQRVEEAAGLALVVKPAARVVDEQVRAQVLEPLDEHVEHDRRGDRTEQDARRPAERRGRSGRSAATARARPRRRPRGAARGAEPAASRPGRSSGADPVALAASCLAAQPRERRASPPRQQHRRDRVIVCANGADVRPSVLSTIVAASGRAGSNEEGQPVERVGREARPPETIASMIASPSARAVASTVPATIAGRAVRTATVHIVRQRLTPSASEPSSTARDRAQAVGDDRDHDRHDHHRQDQRPPPAGWSR